MRAFGWCLTGPQEEDNLVIILKRSIEWSNFSKGPMNYELPDNNKDQEDKFALTLNTK